MLVEVARSFRPQRAKIAGLLKLGDMRKLLDWFSHGSVDKERTHANDELIEIPLAENDPFKKAGNAALFARKTETRAPDIAGRPLTYYNENTHWWDGSQLYASSKPVADALRVKQGATLVAKLRGAHPDMSEDDLYDRARMINAAVMAKIHTIEWTPALLPNPVLNLGMHSNWYGVKTTVAAELKENETAELRKLGRFAFGASEILGHGSRPPG